MNTNNDINSDDDDHKSCLDEEEGHIERRRQAVGIVITADNNHNGFAQEEETEYGNKNDSLNHEDIQEDDDNGKSLMKIRLQTLDYVENCEEGHEIAAANDDHHIDQVEEDPAVTSEQTISYDLNKNYIMNDKTRSYETSLNEGGSRRRESRPGAHAVYPSGQPTTLSIGNDTYDNSSADSSDGTSESLVSSSEELQDEQRFHMTRPLSNPFQSMVVDDLADLERAVQERIEKRTVVATIVTNTTNDQTNNGGEEAKRTTRTKLLMGTAFLVVCLVVMVAIFLTSQGKTEISPSPTMSPSDSTTPLDSLRRVLLPLSGPATLYDESSAQYRALKWLAYEDAYPETLLKDSDGNVPYDDDDLSADSRQKLYERYVIVLLYYSTNGPNWATDLMFLSNTSVCQWPTITEWEDEDLTNAIRCDERSGLVNYIRLDDIGLNGTIPSELASLSSLKKISAFGNALFGTIPSQFGGLMTLVFFQITRNYLSGPIPDSFGYLSKLEYFSIHTNMLTSTIPESLTQLSDLEYLDLSSNYLTGTIPPFANTKLEKIWLELNQLEGSVPSSVFSVQGLENLVLYENYLTGTIATEVGKLTDLMLLDLEYNPLTGTIPSEIGLLTDLTNLFLRENGLNGSIPSEVGHLTRLEYLYLANNLLSGTLPSELGSLSSLDQVEIDGNDWSGSLPSELASIHSLTYLNLANTSFTSNDFQDFCDQTVSFVELHADCGGLFPEVDCPCCAECCDDRTGKCIRNHQMVCEGTSFDFYHDNGRNYEEARGTECKCHNDGYSLACSDTACPACNLDGTICALNTDYGPTWDDHMVENGWHVTFQYVVGRNDTVAFYRTKGDPSSNICQVFVNGQECRACGDVSCDDGFTGFRVMCDNLEGVGNLDICDDNFDDGVLTVLALQDPLLLGGGGCAPRMNS